MRFVILILVTILIGFIIPSNLVQTSNHSQGLYWGFDEGARFDFKSNYTSHDHTNEWNFHVIATNLNKIPDPLILESWVPTAKSWKYDDNETPIASVQLPYAVPIGNWSLLSTIADYHTGVFETETKWGFGYTDGRVSDYETQSDVWEFSKTDGVLVNHTFKIVYDTGLQEVTETLRILPKIDYNVISIVLGSTILIVIIIVIYIWKRKHPST